MTTKQSKVFNSNKTKEHFLKYSTDQLHGVWMNKISHSVERPFFILMAYEEQQSPETEL